STCRSFVTISSGLCRLFAIVVLLHGQNHTSRWTRSMGVDHGLKRREEALHRGIVPDVARPAHRAGDAVIGHQALELLTGVLGRFNRSSQHPKAGGVNGNGKTEVGALNAAEIVLARSATGVAA